VQIDGGALMLVMRLLPLPALELGERHAIQ
jgi:hypothetical protein